MLSKTTIKERLKKKTNSELIETIKISKKNDLMDIASALSRPARKQAKISLTKLNKSKSEIIIVPGKVLSEGEIKRKIKVYALGFSEKAKEKLEKEGCECKTILEALKKDKKLKGEIMG